MNVGIPTRVASVCSGGGGLDLAVRLALAGTRTVLYVEREVSATAVLATRIQGGHLDDAPIWSDARTFDGKPWSGVVDLLVTGFPCQPFSTAGKQRGAEDERNLWPDIARIIGEIRPAFVFIENVPSILRYYFDTVGPGLRDMGYDAPSPLLVSAGEVGGSHVRERFFALAHARHAGEEYGVTSASQGHELRFRDRSRETLNKLGTSGSRVANSAAGGDGGNAEGQRCRPRGLRVRTEPAQPGLERAGCIFPPFASDYDGWARVLAEVPTLEPAVCRVADELAGGVDGPPSSHRGHRLRILGNGVVPLAAAFALSILWREIE